MLLKMLDSKTASISSGLKASLHLSLYPFILLASVAMSLIVSSFTVWKAFSCASIHKQKQSLILTNPWWFFFPSEKAKWPARLPQQAFVFSIGLFSFHHLDGTCDQLSLPSLKTLNLLIICPPYCYIFRAKRLLQNLLQMYTGFLATEQQSWTELFCEAAK